MDNEKLKTLKSDAAAELCDALIWTQDDIEAIDKRLADYLIDLHHKPEDHNVWEILGGVRFVRIFRTYPFNADKVKMTGKKWKEHVYVSYTGYPGGQRYATPEILQKKSERKGLTPGMHPLFLHVIKGMLPKNRLGAQILKNVHIYNGSEHPHEAQQPIELKL